MARQVKVRSEKHMLLFKDWNTKKLPSTSCSQKLNKTRDMLGHEGPFVIQLVTPLNEIIFETNENDMKLNICGYC